MLNSLILLLLLSIFLHAWYKNWQGIRIHLKSIWNLLFLWLLQLAPQTTAVELWILFFLLISFVMLLFTERWIGEVYHKE